MTISHLRRRRVARDLARALAVMSAFMLILSVWTAWRATDSPASAAATAGSMTMTPSTGNSSTEWAVGLPAAAACSGDSAGGNYRVMTYVVPINVDPATVTFDPSGPLPVAGQYRSPLYSSNGETVAGLLTGSAATAGGPGIISGIPAMSWSVFLPGDMPIGDYNMGIACIVGQAGPNQLDKFWNAPVSITADASGGPAEFAFAPAAGGTTTTTGGSTTTTGGGSTTTTADGSTTTTAAGGTTTTAAGGTTTTGGAQVSGSDIFSGGSPSAASPVTTAGQLPYTGSSPVPMIVWAIALLVFGRMAMLLGKRPKVVDGPGA